MYQFDSDFEVQNPLDRRNLVNGYHELSRTFLKGQSADALKQRTFVLFMTKSAILS